MEKGKNNFSCNGHYGGQDQLIVEKVTIYHLLAQKSSYTAYLVWPKYFQMYVQIDNICPLRVLPETCLERSIKSLVLVFPHYTLYGWSRQTEPLVTVYWLAWEALGKATADILAMPRAAAGRTVKEMMTIPQGEILRSDGMGDKLCLPYWPWAFWSAVQCHTGFSLGENNRINAMWTLCASAGCL